MAERRTLRVDFSVLPTKPSQLAAATFLHEKVGLKPQLVERVHFNTTMITADVITKEESIARSITECQKPYIFVQESKEYPIPIKIDDHSVIVKLHDLSAKVTDSDIKAMLSQYGKIITICEGVWTAPNPYAGIRDGHRYVTMVLSHPIPSYVTIKCEKTLLTYRGQRSTCRYCDLDVHYGMTCTMSRKLLAQKPKDGANGRLSFASVLQNGERAGPAPTPITPIAAPTSPVVTPAEQKTPASVSKKTEAAGATVPKENRRTRSTAVDGATLKPALSPSGSTSTPSVPTSTPAVSTSTPAVPLSTPTGPTSTPTAPIDFKEPRLPSPAPLPLPGKRKNECATDSDASTTSTTSTTSTASATRRKAGPKSLAKVTKPDQKKVTDSKNVTDETDL